MSKFIEKILNEVFLKEGKQAGILYHFTSYDGVQSILKENLLRPGSKTFKWGISTTRDKNFHTTEDRVQMGVNAVDIRIALNGSKLSDKYKIMPYSHESFGKEHSTEKEEVIVTETGVTNIKQYILGITIFAVEDEWGDCDKLDVVGDILALCKLNGIKVEMEPYLTTCFEDYLEYGE